jgi:hypothetical protein
MKKDTIRICYARVLLLTLILNVGALAQTASDTVLQQQYSDAVNDARTATADEIVTNLIPIVRCNSNLQWEDAADGASRVLVATWVNEKLANAVYDNKEGQAINIPVDAYPFVTIVPQVKNFCAASSMAKSNLTLRLEQLLGLPPNNGKTKFVQLWVNPNDLFRPCPDPEVTDTRCELEFPTGFLTVSANYANWFVRLYSQSYGANGYPWTRLGYTYDWGVTPRPHTGMSEFVIKPGSSVKICSVTTTEDYCATTQNQKCKL